VKPISLLGPAVVLLLSPFLPSFVAATPRPAPELVLDANGDGRPDRVRPVVADGALWFDLWQAGPDGRLTLRSTQRMHAYVPGHGAVDAVADRWLAFDVDGDGRADLVRLVPTAAHGAGYAEVWRSTGDAFDFAGTRALASFGPLLIGRAGAPVSATQVD
jgi:hypothetical protein